MVEIRRARSLIALFDGDGVVAYNFVARTLLACDEQAVGILRFLENWTSLEALLDEYRDYSCDSVLDAVKQLERGGAVVVRGSHEGVLDEAYERSWRWGLCAGIFHFGTRHQAFLSAEQGERILCERAKHEPSPPLYTLNRHYATVVDIPAPREVPEPFFTMYRRRTNRLLVPAPIRLHELGDCLLFSIGITAIARNPLVIDLPLKMTPSGGARNPYEAYVCARRVEGLQPGIYHYSAYERSLGQMSNQLPSSFSALLADQEWAEDAAALVFLVAQFERPMWKYHDPGALRVVLIEAGHIAQNMILAATAHGFTANPTCAISSRDVEQLLGIEALTHSVVYAVVLGQCSPLPEAPDELDELDKVAELDQSVNDLCHCE